MLDVKELREDRDRFKKAIASKGADPALIDELLKIDGRWRLLVSEIDALRAEQRKYGEEGNVDQATEIKTQLRQKENQLWGVEGERDAMLLKLPNPPLSSVPIGKSPADNVVLREVGRKHTFHFHPKDYLSLVSPLGLIDTERAAKVSGSRFGYLLGAAARLEFALVSFVFEMLSDPKVIAAIQKKAKLSIAATPFIPVIPPVLVNEQSMRGMGYLERGADEVYAFPKDNLYLVGTAEQSLGPMHQGEVLKEEDLPRRYVGFSTCFRREAGSYGKDTKGILRVHQFDKVEMFSFVKPETALEEHAFLLAVEEYLMQQLKLPYRVLNICTADLGDPAAAKYDIEAWMPGQNGGKGEYRETHSTSNTTDFQARRLNIRYRAQGGPKFVHTLNGTAFAIGRMLIAIFENYQTKQGAITIPKVLQKYVGKKRIG